MYLKAAQRKLRPSLFVVQVCYFSATLASSWRGVLDSCWFQIKRHFILTRECNTWVSASARPASAASICAQPGSERGFCGTAARHRTCLWDKRPLVWFLGPQPAAGPQLYSQRCTADLKHRRVVWAFTLTERRPKNSMATTHVTSGPIKRLQISWLNGKGFVNDRQNKSTQIRDQTGCFGSVLPSL